MIAQAIAGHYGIVGSSSEPGELGTCVISTNVVDKSGAPLEGAVGLLVIAELPTEVTPDIWIIGGTHLVTSGADGVITWPAVPRGAKVRVSIPEAGKRNELVTVPDAATLSI